jgi:cystathionine beta-lyase family protein involved in aluminum resistance
VIYLLEVIGFEDVKETKFLQGKDASLFAEQPLRKPYSFYVEGTKVGKKA